MNPHDKDKENYIAYVLGRVETQIEGYAASSQIPLSELSRIVGEFLCGKAGGQLLRGVHSLPTLPNERKRVGRPRKEGRASVAEVAVLGNAHRNVSGRTWSPKSKAKLAKSMKRSWRNRRIAKSMIPKKQHWTQTAEGRKKMAERAKKFWRDGTWKGRAK